MIPSPGRGGAIDPSGFRDADGSRYVVYKVDGNSVGNGGVCKNTVAPIVPTPIMLVHVEEDGVTAIGAPVQILDRDDGDGPLVEAPSLARMSDGTYAVFFSSNCWSTPQYDVSWAAATNITGPYTKYGPMFITGTVVCSRPAVREWPRTARTWCSTARLTKAASCTRPQSPAAAPRLPTALEAGGSKARVAVEPFLFLSNRS